MTGAICRFKPTHVFEWGINIGASARIFYEAAHYFNVQLEIHSIDLPNEISHAERPGDTRDKLVRGLRGVTLHLGDGIDTALQICKNLPKGSSFLFFVDGDHSYKSVKKELETIIANVLEPKILLHDIFYQSVDSGYNIGPFLAIEDVVTGLSADQRLRRMSTHTGFPGMTLLY